MLRWLARRGTCPFPDAACRNRTPGGRLTDCQPLRPKGFTAHIHHISEQLLRVEEGSLYPALHRMEQAGWVRAEWGVTEKNREARFYSLTARGRKQLAEEQESWSRLTAGVALVLRRAGEVE